MRTRTLAFPLLGRLKHTSQAVCQLLNPISLFFREGKRAGEGGGEDKEGERKWEPQGWGRSLTVEG